MSRRSPLIRAITALGVVAVAVSLAACSSGGSPSADSDYVTPGKLTIATAQPAYSPWVVDNKPQNGKGFESAVAYAVAGKLGFAKKDVVWTRTTFDQAIAPGPKSFDFNLQQFSITDERKKAVDFSSPYYETAQAVITLTTSKAADAKSLADLKNVLVGAQTGTTSLTAVQDQIKPAGGAKVFNSNDDAVLALKSGQIDALVVDLPTAFYLTSAELDGARIIGQLPIVKGEPGDRFGLVLDKGSPLTKKVSAAVDALRKDGALDALAKKWLADAGDAPVLK